MDFETVIGGKEKIERSLFYCGQMIKPLFLSGGLKMRKQILTFFIASFVVAIPILTFLFPIIMQLASIAWGTQPFGKGDFLGKGGFWDLYPVVSILYFFAYITLYLFDFKNYKQQHIIVRIVEASLATLLFWIAVDYLGYKKGVLK